jgi:hypothetical protein
MMAWNRLLPAATIAIAALAGLAHDTSLQAADLMAPPSGRHFGMRRYVDRVHGF